MLNRRELLRAAGAAAAFSGLLAKAESGTSEPDRKTIAMVVYPGFTALDLIGPHHVFSLLEGFRVQLVWKNADPVVSDTRIIIHPTLTFKDCPQNPAVIFVPGGTTGTVRMMQDPEMLAFLQSRGANAEYVTSVCTGSLVLGAARLLDGYRATCHWGALEILSALGATPVAERVVQDRNRITGAGVTAGIDFALLLAAKLKDESYAKGVQLLMEYAPAPPFQSGTPKDAGAELTNMLKQMFVPFVQSATEAAGKSRPRR